MRTPKLNWASPVLKAELLDLKYNQGKTYTEINHYLDEKYGQHVTNARLSQIYKSYSQQELTVVELIEEQVNAN